MKTAIVTLITSLLIPMAVHAQDDVYFTPTKEDVKKAKAIHNTTSGGLQKNQPSSNVPFAGNTYYGGINKSDDLYNRRVKQVLATADNMVDSVMSIADSLASDVITFTPSKGVYKSEKPDTVYKYVYVDDEDCYDYCRRISRFDDFYFASRFYGPYWHRYPWWYSYYDPWFGPWYDPWFDPWYDPWYNPWYGSWHYGYYHAWYGPWRDPWYPGYYPGGYFPYGPVIVRDNPGAKYGYTGSHNHSFGGNKGSGFAHRQNSGSKNSNYAIANRNGGSTNITTGRGGTFRGAGRSQDYMNREGSYRNTEPSSYRSSSSGFSGGGRSSGGGSFSGGGRSSGGGHSGGSYGGHSGGSFGGRR